MLQQRQTRSVGPLQVVQHQQKPAFRAPGNLEHEIAYALPHSVALMLGAERRAFFKAWKSPEKLPRHHRDLGRAGAELRFKHIQGTSPNVVSQRFGEGQIRWGPVSLVRPAEKHPPASLVRLLGQLLRESGFADPGLA